ncbi:unnamed protein product [Calypogeia fissa]
MHASSWLGYSWEYADIADSSRQQHPQGASDGCELQFGIASRRDKFRLGTGPSREELLWQQILSILGKIRVPPLPSLESLSPPLPCSSFEFDEYEQRSRASVNGREHSELSVKQQLESVSWPFVAVGDISSMGYSFNISWENIPESADPTRGSGYKTASSCSKIKEQQIPHNDTEEGEEEDDSGSGHCCMGRGERKKLQVENIALALTSFRLKAGSKVVDFGCGSGALTLPLAALLPELSFVAVDFKQQSIVLLEERARKANLQNVEGFHGRIEMFSERFDACVALHACGIATDLALLQALKHRAAYVMSPCCVGKLQIPIQEVILNSAQHMKSQRYTGSISNPGANIQTSLSNIDSFCKENFTNHSRLPDSFNSNMDLEVSNLNLVNGTQTCFVEDRVCQPAGTCVLRGSMDNVSLGLAYPRSKWLRSCISEKEFQVLARAADWSSYDHESSSSRLHSLCKIVVELDRNEASRELGYSTDLFSLSNDKAGTVGVSHILVGKPPQSSTRS